VADRLRTTIGEIFQEVFNKAFVPVTYLGAYEDLRELSLSGLPDIDGACASVSRHRLRKFF